MTATAQAFGALHRGRAPAEPLVLPGPWDAASARVFEEAGFPALATPSAGVAASLGYADGAVPPREMFEAVGRIARAVSVPVSADVEDGYGLPARKLVGRLLDYAKNGGNLIVLYNTQELVPNTFAPFPGELPRSAEEVSEEDSPVTILAPTHQAFTWPNRITSADFEGWVEQRGSKFWSSWDPRYTPIIATWDRGQPPQQGGWLWTRHGKGHYTYFAYAFHRQLPYGVPGDAFELIADRPVEELHREPTTEDLFEVETNWSAR